MPSIDVTKCKGTVEAAAKRLKRLCDKLGIARRLRELEFHEKKNEKRRKKLAAAIKRDQLNKRKK